MFKYKSISLNKYSRFCMDELISQVFSQAECDSEVYISFIQMLVGSNLLRRKLAIVWCQKGVSKSLFKDLMDFCTTGLLLKCLASPRRHTHTQTKERGEKGERKRMGVQIPRLGWLRQGEMAEISGLHYKVNMFLRHNLVMWLITVCFYISDKYLLIIYVKKELIFNSGYIF